MSETLKYTPEPIPAMKTVDRPASSWMPRCEHPNGFELMQMVHEDELGFAIGFNKNGQLCRIGVRVSKSASMSEIEKVWEMFAWASNNPENPKSKARWGYQQLEGFELRLEDWPGINKEILKK